MMVIMTTGMVKALNRPTERCQLAVVTKSIPPTRSSSSSSISGQLLSSRTEVCHVRSLSTGALYTSLEELVESSNGSLSTAAPL